MVRGRVQLSGRRVLSQTVQPILGFGASARIENPEPSDNPMETRVRSGNRRRVINGREARLWNYDNLEPSRHRNKENFASIGHR
jgi:hypothetical protein